MNISRLSLLLGSLSIVVAVSGCTDAGGFARRQTNPTDISSLLAETAVAEQSTIDSSETDRAPAALVQTVSAQTAVQPSLITLPKDGDLNALINSASGPVLLDFYADWCGPCRVQGRILHELEETAAKRKTLIIKVNVDQHRQIAEDLEVSSLPTLMMIKDGQIVQRQSGLAKKNRLVAWMK